MEVIDVDQGDAHPSVLVVDDEPLHRQFAAEVLGEAGWSVETAASGREALDRLHPLPNLILLDLCMAGMSGYEAVAAIRARTDAAATLPVVAYTTLRFDDPQALCAKGFDGYLRKPCSPAELIAAVARWAPDGSRATLQRLRDSFGTTQIDGLADGFRSLLAEAVAALDTDKSAPIAHRVAGVAGTLGFARLGNLWLGLSEGDLSHQAAARAEARRAIAELDRRTTQDHSTSV